MLWKIYARDPYDREGTQEFAKECYQAGVIALGWNELGDLNDISTRKELFDLVRKTWGVRNRNRAVGQWAGALWAFRTEISIGDHIVCPDRNSHQYYVGEVRSKRAYYDDSSLGGSCDFALRRKVKWLRILNRAELESIWPRGQFGGRRTVSKIHKGAKKLARFLGKKRRSFAKRKGLPIQPDMEWGRKAEKRAMEWLRKRGHKPVNEAKLNKGWDISCGELKFEVKGRKSDKTAIRLSQNEWAAARSLRKNYTVLIFTAANENSLKSARPREIVDPTNSPESWEERMVFEYVLNE